MAKDKKKVIHALEDVEVFEVSLVSKPAIGRTYLLTKAEEDPMDEAEPEADTEDEEDEDGEEDDMDKCSTKKEASDGVSKSEEINPMKDTFVTLLKQSELSEEVSEAVVNAFVVLSENKEVLTGVAKEAFEAAGFELPEKEVEVEKIVEKEVIKEVIKEVQPEPEPEEDEGEALLKSMIDGPAKDKMAAFIQKEREEKEAALQKAEDERVAKEAAEQEAITKEFIGEAKEKYEHVGEADALGTLLKSMKESLSEEEYTLAKSVFDSAEQHIVIAKQFEELGSGGPVIDSNKTSDKIEALAKAAMEKDNTLTIEQARVQVVQNDQQLWLEYNGG